MANFKEGIFLNLITVGIKKAEAELPPENQQRINIYLLGCKHQPKERCSIEFAGWAVLWICCFIRFGLRPNSLLKHFEK